MHFHLTCKHSIAALHPSNMAPVGFQRVGQLLPRLISSQQKNTSSGDIPNSTTPSQRLGPIHPRGTLLRTAPKPLLNPRGTLAEPSRNPEPFLRAALEPQSLSGCDPSPFSCWGKIEWTPCVPGYFAANPCGKRCYFVISSAKTLPESFGTRASTCGSKLSSGGCASCLLSSLFHKTQVPFWVPLSEPQPTIGRS